MALLCVGLSITNYLNITIFGDQNELSDFKGNRSKFLQVDGESTTITSFEQFGEPKYKSNALTIEDTPVKIQVLDSEGNTINHPCINIANTESTNTSINFRINDTTNGSKTINQVGLYGEFTIFSADQNTLSFVSDDVLAPCLFNLAPYLNTVDYISSEGRYNLSPNRNYEVTGEATITSVNDKNFFFYLPSSNSSGEYINFLFTGSNGLFINNAKNLKMRWGPPGILAPNSVIENYYSNEGIFTNKQQDTGNFGAFNIYDANNILGCYCDSGRTLLGKKNGSSNTSVGGLIVKFSSVPTTGGFKWAVEIDNVYPMVKFQFNNDWSEGDATNI